MKLFKRKKKRQLNSRTSTNLLKSKNLLTTLEDGRQVIDFSPNQRIVISKSDGSSLYITRDIAAALDRIQKFHPHQMFYVVEQGQEKHFSNLFKILSSVIEEEDENSNSFSNTQRTCEFKHIMFGRIQGMSTRKGTAVFLSDILEEASQRSESSQIWVFKKNFKRKKHWYLLKNKLFSTRCR